MQQSERTTLLKLPLEAVPFALFDLESTGLDPATDRICEVALARWQGGAVVERFQALIDPGQPVNPDAFAVNGISAEMIAGQPTFAETAPALLAALGDAVLVAHNAPFDVCFLNTELLAAGLEALPNPVIDTLALARNFVRHDRYNLGALAERLGRARPTHRAMSDVEALEVVFNDLLQTLRQRGVETLEDLLRAQHGALPGGTAPTADQRILDALQNGQRLRIAYRTNGGDPVPRDILPIGLQMSSGLPRLIAYCFLRNAQRTFYLDRIAELEVAE